MEAPDQISERAWEKEVPMAEDNSDLEGQDLGVPSGEPTPPPPPPEPEPSIDNTEIDPITKNLSPEPEAKSKDRTAEQIEAMAPEINEEVPASVERVFVISDDRVMTCVQEQLGYIPKWEIFRLVAKGIREAADAESLQTLREVFSRVGGNDEQASDEDEFSIEQLMDVAGIVKIVANMAFYSPELISDLLCIALQVKKRHRKLAIELWERPVSQGGLTDELADEILKLFVRQNAKGIRDFFAKHLNELWTEATKATGATLPQRED